MGGDQNNQPRPPLGMADRPAVRSPLDELRAEVTTLSDNPLLPAGIRSTLRRAVTVLLDQEQRIKALEVARHG